MKLMEFKLRNGQLRASGNSVAMMKVLLELPLKEEGEIWMRETGRRAGISSQGTTAKLWKRFVALGWIEFYKHVNFSNPNGGVTRELYSVTELGRREMKKVVNAFEGAGMEEEEIEDLVAQIKVLSPSEGFNLLSATINRVTIDAFSDGVEQGRESGFRQGRLIGEP